jgi:hypothetical protein
VALGNETSEVRTGRKSRNLLIDIGKQLLDGTGLSHGELLNGNPTRMAPERNNGKHELKTESRNAGMHPSPTMSCLALSIATAGEGKLNHESILCGSRPVRLDGSS